MSDPVTQPERGEGLKVHGDCEFSNLASCREWSVVFYHRRLRMTLCCCESDQKPLRCDRRKLGVLCGRLLSIPMHICQHRRTMVLVHVSAYTIAGFSQCRGQISIFTASHCQRNVPKQLAADSSTYVENA